MGYTALQLKQMGATPITTATPTPNQTGGYTQQQVMQMGGKPVEDNPVVGAVKTAANYVTGSISNAFSSGYQQAQQGQEQGTNASNPLQLLEGGTKLVAGAINAAAAPLAPIFAPIGAAVNAVADQVSNSKAVQGFAMGKGGDIASRVAEDVGNVATVASLPVAAELGAEAKAKAEAAKQDAINNPKPVTPPVDTEIQTQLKGVADDWKKPTLENTAGFDKARAVLAKDPETPQFLAEHGLNPFSHIEDGKYNTESSAAKLRDTAGKMSRDTLRPSLQMADYQTPKTPVADLTSPSVSEAGSSYGVTPDDLEAIQTKINSKVSALERKYPDGMSLTDMHDEGITFNQNGGYSPVKDPAVNNNAIANRALGTSLKQMVVDKAPADVPVKEFNQYLSKYYRAADYLDTLDGKKAPVSVGQQFARYASKIAGAKLGSLLPFGGDIVGEIAGYHIGGALERAAENLTNPMRDSFLRNLKITNPEAFTKVSEFISKQEAEGVSRPLLPSGDVNGVPKVITAQPTADQSGVKIIPAKKVLPTANPKTGKMQKTYSSESGI